MQGMAVICGDHEALSNCPCELLPSAGNPFECFIKKSGICSLFSARADLFIVKCRMDRDPAASVGGEESFQRRVATGEIIQS